jgi:hypothetical protein
MKKQRNLTSTKVNHHTETDIAEGEEEESRKNSKV